jgi:hypothetical protein
MTLLSPKSPSLIILSLLRKTGQGPRLKESPRIIHVNPKRTIFRLDVAVKDDCLAHAGLVVFRMAVGKGEGDLSEVGPDNLFGQECPTSNTSTVYAL